MQLRHKLAIIAAAAVTTVALNVMVVEPLLAQSSNQSVSVPSGGTGTCNLAVNAGCVINCPNGVLNANLGQSPFEVVCDASSQTGTTTTVPGTTSTTAAPGTTTTAAPPSSTTTAAPPPSSTTTGAPPTSTTTAGDAETGAPGNCTNPVWSTSDAEGTDNLDPSPLPEYWWIDNDAWSGGHGPQSLYVCNQQSWYAVSNQTDQNGAVETYPDSEYDVGGRANGAATQPISAYNSITSTFSEDFPSGGTWDAAYDLWLNNWSTEIMIWNQWAGDQSYWPGIATTEVNLGGVGYKFYDNGGELMFFRDSQASSGSVNILAAFSWLASNGYVSSSDVPTQLEYGVEICATNGDETFPLTGLTFNVS